MAQKDTVKLRGTDAAAVRAIFSPAMARLENGASRGFRLPKPAAGYATPPPEPATHPSFS